VKTREEAADVLSETWPNGRVALRIRGSTRAEHAAFRLLDRPQPAADWRRRGLTEQAQLGIAPLRMEDDDIRDLNALRHLPHSATPEK
jgi:hypothetical protein